MPHFDQFKQQVNLLYAMIRLQKGVRLALRGLWMGVAGILSGWAIHALTGWLPNPLTWFGLGLVVALVPIAGIVAALYPVLTDVPPSKAWIYALDRRLGMRQQLSTGWEVVERGQHGPVTDLLVADLAALMPRARAQILANGWYRKVDLVASTLMTLLACALLAALLLRPAAPPTAADPAQQPSSQQSLSQPDPQQPNGPDQQPGAGQNGSNGDQNGADPNNNGASQPENAGSSQQSGSSNGSDQGSSPSSDPAAGQNPEDTQSVANALRQLGQELSKQAGTYDLGQALQNLQMNPAADALQNLKDQLKDLSPESRDNLSQALENAAKNLDQANQPNLSQDMQNAASALKDSNGSPDQPLNQLSQDLRQLDNAMQASQSAGSGAGQGQSASSGQVQPPADRLPDENGQMELPLDNPQNSGLLSPARPDATGEGTAQGSLNANRPQGSSTGQNPLLPNSMLWKWRHVVSQYFQR